MVVIDASMLMLFLRPDTPGPRDESGAPLPYAIRRVEHLIGEIDKSGEKVAIPTPALSEVLVRGGLGDAQRIIEIVNRKRVFSIESFDQRAAIEVAMMLRHELQEGTLKDATTTWAKLKFDRQIVAIAKVCKATAMYSEDDDIHRLAERSNIPCYRVRDLEIPPEDEQLDMLKDRADDPNPPA